MKELVFLLEEPSAKAMLESLLPRILSEGIAFRCIPFEGKQDLEKQLSRKIRAYQNSAARFIVLRDQDSHPDCAEVKRHLLELCQLSGRAAQCLVRIACRELEAFYLADLSAVERALGIPGLAQQQQSRKFRSPDTLGSPSQELRKLTKGQYAKVSGSRAIGRELCMDNARSPSFYHLLTAIKRMERELINEAV
jgi:hypothetical protein